MIPTPQPDPAQPAAEAIVPLETEAPALPLLPASPAASRVLGVVDKPELVFLLQKAGLDARPLSYAQLEVGALDRSLHLWIGGTAAGVAEEAKAARVGTGRAGARPRQEAPGTSARIVP